MTTTKRNNSALIAIDLQKDFHDNIPGSTLAVPGSTKDTERTCAFIRNLDPATIFASRDSHYNLDISHPDWWEDAKGNTVKSFTLIMADDIKNGKYVPRMDYARSLAYVEALEKNGEFLHFIWPPHCLIGSDGQSFHPLFMEAVCDWNLRNRKWVNFVTKGVNPFTEHFGMFRANVPIDKDPNTQVDQAIFKTLQDHDDIYLVGQARTHCDANSLRQLLQIAPQLASKVIVLEDCMSNVPGLPDDFYAQVDKIYADAYAQGVRKMKSTDL